MSVSTRQPLMGDRANQVAGDIEMANPSMPKDVENVPLDWLTPPDIRLGFIRKVYGILCVQLVVTALIGAPFALSEGVKHYAQENPQWLMIFALGNLVCSLMFACGPSRWRNEFPTNYILLGVFTVCEGFVVGFVCAQYTGQSIILAFSATAALCAGLSLYAINTKHDFTGYGPYLFAACWALLIATFFLMLFPVGNFQTSHKMYAAVCLVLFSLYLVYDTQLVVGGDHRNFQLTVDDYVFGAIILYLDIIQIFLQILELLGSRDQ